MLTTLFFLTFVLLVSAGNLALGFGLAVHMGHGPERGWRALCFWKRGGSESAEVAPDAKPTDGHH